MKKSILIMLTFTLSIMLTGCSYIEKQIKEQEAEGIIKDYYQAIIDEDYEKAFEQLHLYDYDAKTDDNDVLKYTFSKLSLSNANFVLVI
ncbi:outer membrane protein assembly factor BamD [Oceanobacillus salinisoli]|uniref:hypothetical protein n=1 Tax=Oceanobacillus salinisoli TaxID=2678611 RepID=UPI0012E23A65|nr:hypothetical protein [Oceanobacillus salinisoli]